MQFLLTFKVVFLNSGHVVHHSESWSRLIYDVSSLYTAYSLVITRSGCGFILVLVLSSAHSRTLGTLSWKLNKYILYSRWVKIVVENFEYTWDIQTRMTSLPCPLYAFLVLFMVKKLFKNSTQRSLLRQDGLGGMWEDTGRHLSWLSPPAGLDLQNSWQNVLKRCDLILAMPKRNSLLHCAVVWPAPIKYSVLFSTLKNTKMLLDQIQFMWQALW